MAVSFRAVEPVPAPPAGSPRVGACPARIYWLRLRLWASGRGTPYPASDKTVSVVFPMYEVVQVVGSLLILAAFVAAQLRRLDQSSYRYLIANAVGSAVLTVTAVVRLEWGFILLEGAWALMSIYSMVRKAAGRLPAAPH